MPKDKKRAPSSDSDSSGPEDRTPVKKGKLTPKPAPKPAASRGDEEPSWHLGRERYVKVREFKGKTYVDIREYYVDKNTMETKPGKKGISLNTEQYQKLKSIIDEIDHALP